MAQRLQCLLDVAVWGREAVGGVVVPAGQALQVTVTVPPVCGVGWEKVPWGQGVQTLESGSRNVPVCMGGGRKEEGGGMEETIET